jgi:Rrf2 family protein
MRFSTKARYGLRIVMRLAEECAKSGAENKPIPLWLLAEKERISKKYVEHIATQLERAGVLKGFRGPAGGYCLAKPPSRITAREVIEAVEIVRANVCTQKLSDCPLYPSLKKCKARQFWIGLEKAIRDYMENATIKSLLNGKMGGKKR